MIYAHVPRVGPSDPVAHPKHYQRGGIETIDYIRATLTPEQFEGYCIGNALKYLSRYRDKDGLQDLRKANVYLQWAVTAAQSGHEPTQFGHVANGTPTSAGVSPQMDHAP